jgi:hypothetical protein
MSRQSSLEIDIAGLSELPRPELIERWQVIYKCPPPKGIRRGLIERAVVWHLQAKYYGGLSPQVRRELKMLAADHFGLQDSSCVGNSKPADFSPSPASDPSLSEPASVQPITPSPADRLPRPGSRLVREWHGRVYHVDVIEEGYVFEGKTYQSLSVIARLITGAHWSGPRFFGLGRR